MIIERLKGFWRDDLELEHRQVIVRNAIEQIETLRAENERLRDSIKIYTQDHVRLVNELLRNSFAHKSLGETE